MVEKNKMRIKRTFVDIEADPTTGILCKITRESVLEVQYILKLQTTHCFITRETIVNNIIADLDFAINNLPDAYYNEGRLTKYAALALKTEICFLFLIQLSGLLRIL